MEEEGSIMNDVLGGRPREININVKFSKLVIEVIYKVELNDEQQKMLNQSVKSLTKSNQAIQGVLDDPKPEGGDK